MPFMPFADQKTMDLAVLILTYVMLGWGLNIVVGLAGLLDLGYVAFYAVGAYSYALLSTAVRARASGSVLPLAGMLAASVRPAAGLSRCCACAATISPSSRLGFGEIIRLVLINWVDLTQRPGRHRRHSRPDLLRRGRSRETRAGRQADLRRDDGHPVHRQPAPDLPLLHHPAAGAGHQPLHPAHPRACRSAAPGRRCARTRSPAARSASIPTNTKLTAFAIGAMFAGFAGSFFAAKQRFISPESFTFIESAIILAIVVLGGMGSQIGVVLAARAADRPAGMVPRARQLPHAGLRRSPWC